jgi:hypothetical protein
MSAVTKKVYRGWLVYGTNGEKDEILSLAPIKTDVSVPANLWYDDEEDTPFISKMVQRGMDRYGHYTTVRYFASPSEFLENEAAERFIRALYGTVKAEYAVAYSEITGYLWTTDDFKVGGHDMIQELKSYLGQYLQLEVDYQW